jgi:hypothetical protein
MLNWWTRYRPIVLLLLIVLGIVLACTGCAAMAMYTPDNRGVLEIFATWAWTIAKAWLGVPKQDEFMQFLQALTWLFFFIGSWEVLTNLWKIVSYPWKIVSSLRRNRPASMVKETNPEIEAEKMYGSVPPGYSVYLVQRPVEGFTIDYGEDGVGFYKEYDRWQHPSQYNSDACYQIIAPNKEIAIQKAMKYQREGLTQHAY